VICSNFSSARGPKSSEDPGSLSKKPPHLLWRPGKRVPFRVITFWNILIPVPPHLQFFRSSMAHLRFPNDFAEHHDDLQKSLARGLENQASHQPVPASPRAMNSDHTKWTNSLSPKKQNVLANSAE